jgi:hypothetical protein
VSGGTGYTATTSLTTTSTTGVGAGLTVDIAVSGTGVVTGVTISCAGSGYEVGDIVQIIQPGSGVQVTSKNVYQSYLKSNPNIPKKEVDLINSMINSESNEKAVNTKLRSINDIYDRTNTFDKEFDQQVENKLYSKTGKFTPIVENLDASKPKLRQDLEGMAGSILLRYTPGGGGLPGGDEFLANADAVKAREWFTGEGKGDLQYKRIKQGGNDYLMVMKGTESALLKMTPNEAIQIPTSVDTYSQNIREKQSMFGGSTNATGKVEDAEYQRNTFKNTRKYAVVADLKNDPTSPEDNYINLKVKINGTWQPLQLDNNRMTAIKARALLSNMTDEDIEKILTSKGISFK